MTLTSLTGSQAKQFQEALLSAYPSRSALTRMVKFGLDENLDTITSSGNLSETDFELITWAEAQGRLEALLAAARAEAPGNVLLQKLERQLMLTAAVPGSNANPLPMNGSGSQPDRIAVREAIKQHYSLDELRILCDDLGLVYENLPGETIDRKALELVDHFRRHGPSPYPYAPLVAAMRKRGNNII